MGAKVAAELAEDAGTGMRQEKRLVGEEQRRVTKDEWMSKRKSSSVCGNFGEAERLPGRASVGLMMRPGYLGALVGLGLIAAAGCRRTTNVDMACEEGLLNEAQPCDTTDPCACGTEGICFDGLCRMSCESDSSCSGGALCIKDSGGNGACMLLSEQACSASKPCSNPRLVCGGDGQCRLPCNDANPCRSNDQSCLFGACYGKNERDAETWLCKGAEPGPNGEQLRCNGATLEICNVIALGWAPRMTCESEELCRIGRSEGTCASPACSDGEVRCSGAALERCSDDLSEWERIDTCETAGLCQQGLAAGGSQDAACAAAQCVEAAVDCDGATMIVCKADRSGWDRVQICANSELCRQGLPDRLCKGAACIAGALSCAGSVLQRCTEDSTSNELIDTCGSPALCIAALGEEQSGSEEPSCVDAACNAREYGCDGANMRRCRDDRTGWDLVQSCATPELCVQGLAGQECATPFCLAGSISCTGSTLQRCRDDSTGYDPVDTCASAERCAESLIAWGTGDELACVQDCTPDALECDGAILRRCLPNGSGFDSLGTCATEALCEAAVDAAQGSCGEPVCADGEYRCVGAELERCNAGRTGFEPSATCSSATLCLPGIAGKCMDGGEALIDNLEDGDRAILPHDGRSGGWYGISDPSADTYIEIVPSLDRAGSLNAIHFLGSGFENWGAEFGFTLVADTATETHRIYDASGYAGIQFWARRDAGDGDVVFTVQPTKDFPEHGCVPEAGECWGYFGARIHVGQTWGLYQLRWDELAPISGTRTNDVARVDPSALTSIVFKFSPGDEVDLYVDDPAFMLPETAGSCNAGELRCAGLSAPGGATSGPSLERCSADGQGWELVDNCGTARACGDPNLGANFENALSLGVCPRNCTPGSGECRGRESWICNQEGTGYVLAERCDLPAFCVQGEHPRCTRPDAGVIDDFEGGNPSFHASPEDSVPPILFHQGRFGYWRAWVGDDYVGPAPTIALASDAIRAAEGAGYGVLDWRAEQGSTPSVLGLSALLAGYPNSAGRAGYAYDASDYAGLYLTARSPTGTAVRLRLSDENTDWSSPARTAEAAAYLAPLALSQEWNTYVFAFDDLTLDPLAAASLPAHVDPSSLYELGFERPRGVAASEILIDDIGFYPASTPSPDCAIGGYSCLGPVLQQCQTEDTLTTVAICSSQASCLAGRSAGICVSDCELDAGLCMGSKRFVCRDVDNVRGYDARSPELCDSSAQCEAGPRSRCWDESLIDNLEGGSMSIPVIDGRVGRWDVVSWSEFGSATATNVFDGSGHVMRFEGRDLTTSVVNATIGSLSHASLGVVFEQLYDASGAAGIRFRARKGGGSGATAIRVELADGPNQPELPGTCDPDASACYSFFGVSFSVTPEWQTFEFLWEDLERAWEPDPSPSAAVAPGSLIGLRWRVGTGDFSLEVDDVQFM